MCLLASLLYASVYIFIFLFPTNFISVMIARVTDNLYSFLSVVNLVRESYSLAWAISAATLAFILSDKLFLGPALRT